MKTTKIPENIQSGGSIMGGRRYDDIDARYQSSFGVLAGYLPKDRAVLDQWHTERANELTRVGLPEEYSWPSVQQLAQLLDDDSIIRMYVTEMIDQVQYLPYPPNPNPYPTAVKNVPELLAVLDQIVTEAPSYGTKERPGIRFPMSALFGYMMMTQAGEAVFRNKLFNEALRAILTEWCNFLDSKDSCSRLTTRRGDWLSLEAVEELDLNEYVTEEDKGKKHWGFTSWNNFFYREFVDKDKSRPVSAPDDPRVIVSANDGQVSGFISNVQKNDTFWAKGERYSLNDMLNKNYVDRFIGGDVIQSFLSGSDYHRFVAPIAGTIQHAEVVPGLLFSNSESAGYDPAGINSLVYDATVNTRGLVFIEEKEGVGSSKKHMVCVIPIGITEISSIILKNDKNEPLKTGDEVTKGDQLGYIGYGGSTLCIVFEPGMIDYYTLPASEIKVTEDPDDPDADPQERITNPIVRARKQIALTKESHTGDLA